MKTVFLQQANLSCRKQRVHLLILTLFGMLAIFLVVWLALPALLPDTKRGRTRFSAGGVAVSATAPARQGLHLGEMTSPFDRSHYLYLRMGSNVWFLEARTPLE
jgi:hypothetical protein